MANNTYVQLVNRAIGSFNSIFSAMANKGNLLTEAEKLKESPIRTEDYGDRIARLTYIENLRSQSAPHVIYDFTGLTKGLTGEQYIYTGTDLKVTGSIVEAGYYTNGVDTATKIEVLLETTALDFSTESEMVEKVYNTAAVESSGLKAYLVKPTNSVILRSVEIAAGSAEAEIKSTKHTITASNVLTSAVSSTALDASTYLLEQGNGSTKEGYKELSIKINSTVSGSSKATATTTFTPGYIDKNGAVDSEESVKEIGSGEGQVNLNKEGYATVYIKEASVALKLADDAEASATITSEDSTYTEAVLFTDTAADGIALNAAVGDLPIEAEIVPGYVAAGAKIESDAVSVSSSTKYLVKGSAPDQVVTAQFGDITDDGGITTTNAVGAYAITVPVAASTTKKTVNTGFILGSDAGNVTLAGSKEVYIKKGSVTVTPSITGYTVGGIASQTAADGSYEITVTPVLDADLGLNVEKGIVTTGDVRISEAETSNKELKAYVAKAVVEHTSENFVVTPVDDTETGGNVGDVAALFLDSAPSGDYFKLDTTYGYSISAGYIENKELSGGSTKYMPKAVFEWITPENGGEEYLQVTTGGYLPSGKITEIAAVPENNAVIALSANGGGITLLKESDTKEADKTYYDITISPVIDAGYISQTQGTITGTKYSVKAGSIKVEPTVAASGLGNVVREVSTDGNGVVTYKLPVNVTANAGLVYEAGYVMAGNVNTTNAEKALSVDAVLQQAKLTDVEHSTSIVLNSDVVVAAGDEEETSYIITPSITACSTTLQFSEGYITSAEADKITHSVGAHGIANAADAVFRIHAGNKDAAEIQLGTNTLGIAAIDAAGKITSAAVNGLYSLELAGDITATGKITDPGYYVASTFTKTNTITAKTFKIKQGTVTPSGITVDAEVKYTVGEEQITDTGIYSESIKLYESDADGEGERTFLPIKVEADVTSTATVTEGYVKAEEIGTDATYTYRNTKYIETYNFVEHQIGQSNEYVIPEVDPTENESIVIETAGKYLASNINVKLSDDAMGKNVVASMADLEARLNGIF